ncbi:MAG: sigma-54 dependent transcriptional regulator [Planctomycetota bacterium]
MADILIVDDEENLSYSIQLGLKRAGHDCRVADTVASALAECARKAPAMALVDVQLPDGNGIDLMTQLRVQGFDVPIVVITAFGTVATAVAAMKQGAEDFIQKPVSIEEVCLVVDRCLEGRRLRNQLDAYQEAQRRQADDSPLIGECPQIREVVALADRIASIQNEPGTGLVATLLLGATGTGKELVARHIHRNCARPDRPFVHVNCSAIPESLFEAELLGFERGTFTDAKAAKKGLLEVAHESTLFLDEIGDMPLATQSKLLVAIENGRFRRLGSTTETAVDVRVIAATNADLQQKLEAGQFRADLYYRLKMFCIELPPLRARGDDLFLLAEHFIQRFSRKFRKPAPKLTEATKQLIRTYPWPGNVRELANVIQRAVLINDADTLDPTMLGIGTGPVTVSDESGIRFDLSQGDCTLASMEKRLLQAALQHTGGNISETARLLGLTRGSLRHRLEKLGLASDESARRPHS